MKTFALIIILTFFCLPLGFAQTTIAKWTYETSQPTNSGATITGIIPEIGIGIASGTHADAGTVYSHPSGNGSANSFSANRWTSGDYYQFQVATLGFSDIKLSWDQTRSATGPATWDLAYSTDGANFTVGLDNYTVPAISWVNATPDGTGTTSFTLDLSSATGLNNVPTAYFRIVADSSPSSTAGTSRNDNFTITATPVPEPQSLFLVGGLGVWAWGLLRRRLR